MIGHAHIDPVWLWPWTEGISVVHSTFRSALDRMKEYPDVAFIASSAQFYEWVANTDPGMFSEIKQFDRIKAAIWWSGIDYDQQGNPGRIYLIDEDEGVIKAFRDNLEEYKGK